VLSKLTVFTLMNPTAALNNSYNQTINTSFVLSAVVVIISCIKFQFHYLTLVHISNTIFADSISLLVRISTAFPICCSFVHVGMSYGK